MTTPSPAAIFNRLSTDTPPHCYGGASVALLSYSLAERSERGAREGYRAESSMAVEIERKFLVENESWRAGAGEGRLIRQGYLASTEQTSVRVRIADGRKATLTVKVPRTGLSRFEFENEIALHEANTLLDLCPGDVVEKRRFQIPHGGLTWEIDVYRGHNEGLVVAEVELDREDRRIERPRWLGREITGDERFQNSRLAERPFATWSRPEREREQQAPQP